MSSPPAGTPDTFDERALATALFNGTWDLMEQKDRTPADDDRMLHMAHASRYHWEHVGTAANVARGEWQCSRVYAVLGRAEPALHHATRALQVCEEAGIGDWDLAFCYEALARAHAVAGNGDERGRWLEQGRRAATAVADPHDRQHLLDELASVPTA